MSTHLLHACYQLFALPEEEQDKYAAFILDKLQEEHTISIE